MIGVLIAVFVQSSSTSTKTFHNYLPFYDYEVLLSGLSYKLQVCIFGRLCHSAIIEPMISCYAFSTKKAFYCKDRWHYKLLLLSVQIFYMAFASYTRDMKFAHGFASSNSKQQQLDNSVAFIIKATAQHFYKKRNIIK